MTGLSPPGPLNEVNLACRRRVLESQKENPLATKKTRQEATKSQIDALPAAHFHSGSFVEFTELFLKKRTFFQKKFGKIHLQILGSRK